MEKRSELFSEVKQAVVKACRLEEGGLKVNPQEFEKTMLTELSDALGTRLVADLDKDERADYLWVKKMIGKMVERMSV